MKITTRLKKKGMRNTLHYPSNSYIRNMGVECSTQIAMVYMWNSCSVSGQGGGSIEDVCKSSGLDITGREVDFLNN